MPSPMTTGERLADKMTGENVRKHAITYDEFITSSYAREMHRRFEYYEGRQFRQNPTMVSDADLYSSTGAITPETWNASLSGYGWEDIKSMLPDATREQCIHPTGIPFVNIIIDNKQVVYTVPPESREVYKNGKAVEKSSKLLDKVYQGCNHDGLADQLCKWTGLFDTAFQFIGWDPRNKRLVKRNLKPYEVFVIPSAENPTDLQHPDAFVAIAQLDIGLTDREAPQREVIWQCWHKDRFWYETFPRSEYKDLGLTKPGTNPNPYRDAAGNPVKPILSVHSKEATDIYYQGADNLVLLNQRLDRDLTAISHTMEFQGFALLAFEGMDPEEVRGMSPSAGGAVALPNGAKASYVHPVIQMGEFLNAIISKARAFARMVGVDPELVDPKVSAGSGVSKAIGRRALAERREEQFPKWLPYERESYWLTAIVWNYHAANQKLDDMPRYDSADDTDVYKIEVIFGELDPVVDPLAEAQKLQTELKLNLITRAEVLASRRRISPEAAETLAKEIKDINEADGISIDVNAAPMRLGQPGNRPTNPDRPADKVGGNITVGSGNSPIDQNRQRLSGAGET